MADEEKRREEATEEEEEDALWKRFPNVPSMPDTPEPPKLSPNLPPHPSQPRPGSVAPGAYNKAAIATTAASAFIMPIVVLSVGGWLLDTKLHTTPWLAFGGVVLGFIAGIAGLLQVTRRLSE